MILLWKAVVLEVGVQWQEVWFAENLGKNGTKSCLTSKNGAQSLQKNTWRPFFETTPKTGHNYLSRRNFVGKRCTKTFSGMFGKIQEKILRPQKICLLLHQSWKRHLRSYCPGFERTAGEIPRHASILRRPYAYYSTHALFTRCRLQCVIVMNINYPRYPMTEQLITAKISSNALKQRSSRTHSALRQHSSQLQKYKAARMSRRRAVDQACDWDSERPELTVWNL